MSLGLIGSEELEKFYKQEFYFSYSGINKLLFSPLMFYKHYILQQREDSTDAHLVTGKALHCLLLEPEKFDEQFLIIPSKIPSENQKKIIDNIFKYHLTLGNNTLILSDYSNEILTELLNANLHQSLKTDQQRIDKILTPENITYFAYLKASIDKSVISQATYDSCVEAVELLKSNKDVAALLQLDENERNPDTVVLNELQLSADIDGLSFGFKGVLDNVVIDKESKTVFINDLKTTGKAIQDFPESVEYYRYWIQAAIYVKLVESYLFKSVAKGDWKIQVTFIVIDKYNLIYPYQVSLDTLASWQDKFENEVVPQLVWHYENKRYDLPYELATGNVKL